MFHCYCLKSSHPRLLPTGSRSLFFTSVSLLLSWYRVIVTIFLNLSHCDYPVSQKVKDLPAMKETLARSLGQEDPLEKGMATHSSILVWRIPWTEESGRLQSIALQNIRHDWSDWVIFHCVYVPQLLYPFICRWTSRLLPRAGHDWATSLSLFTFMHWRRKWQPTPVFLLGESQGRGSFLGCRLWGLTESDTNERMDWTENMEAT